MGRVVALLLVLTGVARAQAPDDRTERARAHVKAAIAYYDEARYDDAAREMHAAYELKTIVVYKYAPPPPGRAARWAAYGLWALGAAGIAVGIAYAVLAAQAADDVTHGGDPNNPMPFDGALRATQESGKTYPVISGVSFGIGGLAVAGGVALWLIGRKIDKEAPKLTLAPALLPSGGGLFASGKF